MKERQYKKKVEPQNPTPNEIANKPMVEPFDYRNYAKSNLFYEILEQVSLHGSISEPALNKLIVKQFKSIV